MRFLTLNFNHFQHKNTSAHSTSHNNGLEIAHFLFMITFSSSGIYRHTLQCRTHKTQTEGKWLHHQLVKMNYGNVRIYQLLYTTEIMVNNVKEYCTSFDRPNDTQHKSPTAFHKLTASKNKHYQTVPYSWYTHYLDLPSCMKIDILIWRAQNTYIQLLWLSN